MAWGWLILGGLFEVGFTTSLRFVDGFRNGPWTAAFLVSVALSMGLLELASRTKNALLIDELIGMTPSWAEMIFIRADSVRRSCRSSGRWRRRPGRGR